MTSVTTFEFKNVKLNKAHVLGTGSYGAVCKAKCDDLPCAAKLLHLALFELHDQTSPNQGRQSRQPLKRFEQECQFLSQIKHPNIVQYLGTYNDPDTKAPVLLMELMDESLTHFLKSTPGPVAYHVQVNICHDIALALSYLHSNDIIHRDLSSNNVLLIAGSRAKVTDFGMSKLTDTKKNSLTLCPGTAAYMSPEALNEPSVYTEKLDIFSHGVLMIQIMTKLFPEPSDRFTSIEVSDPRDPKKKTVGRFSVTEEQRRQSHIDKVPKDNSLLPIALLCLSDEDKKRPSASELCHSLEVLKDHLHYKESVTSLDNTIEIFKSLIEEQLNAHKTEVAQLKSELKEAQEEIKDKEQALQIKTKQLGMIKQLVTQNDLEEQEPNFTTDTTNPRKALRLKLDLERSWPPLHSPLSPVNSSPHQSPLASPVQKQKYIKLKWKTGPIRPEVINTHTGTLQLDGTVCYVKSEGFLCTFNIQNYIMVFLCKLPNKGVSIEIVNNLVTAIGGRNSQNQDPSNKILSLVRKEMQHNWEEIFPPMTTGRYEAITFSTDKILAVAGGIGQDNLIIQTAEIMTLSTQQWSSISSLPCPLWGATIAVSNGMVYMLGGEVITGANAVFTCSLNELCKSKQHCKSAWKSIKELPVIQATATSFQGHLLAVGGKDLISGKPDTAIRQYNPLTDDWHTVSHMKKAKAYCYTHVYDDTFIVFEGVDSSRQITNQLEIANLKSK